MFGITKVKTVPSTPFADFIRNASSGEKKRVYERVLKKATERQNRVLVEAASK
ncbi:hypothetical protein [Pseudomonas sp.]|uniref:hypothetical protein n=1 Tax=Pseudomonas sp. TaxID=306 RepID=UPI00299F0E80|nr:hypothetical protein [Pseudomonas sp.]MDX1366501.1 hypothetical protein [Pseudomonas sp.]